MGKTEPGGMLGVNYFPAVEWGRLVKGLVMETYIQVVCEAAIKKALPCLKS